MAIYEECTNFRHNVVPFAHFVWHDISVSLAIDIYVQTLQAWSENLFIEMDDKFPWHLINRNPPYISHVLHVNIRPEYRKFDYTMQVYGLPHWDNKSYILQYLITTWWVIFIG